MYIATTVAVFLLLSFFPPKVVSKDVKYFDNFIEGDLVFGLESLITDYVVLANDPVSNLPPAFTVCSSLFLHHMSTNKDLVQLFQEDGSHWIHMEIEQLRNFNDFTEKVTLNFNGKSHNFWNTNLPIHPHSWYHAFLGLDAEYGHLRAVINGYTVVDEVIPSFKDSQDKRPRSLVGKLKVFKVAQLGYWYQSRGIFSNMNVYGSLLSLDAMVLITNGNKCGESGDYLSWDNMEWNISGSVEQGSISIEELCYRENTSMILLNDIFLLFEDCMTFCPKLNKARSPLTRTRAQFENLITWVQKTTTNPENKEFYPGVIGGANWISLTDEDEEGNWIDYYTKEKIKDAREMIVGGELNGGTKENCAIMVLMWNGWNDWQCTINKNQPIACACQHPQEMYLRLRGLCQDSNIDQYYVPRNKPKNGAIIYVGLSMSVIEYLPENSIWKLEFHGGNTSAETESSHYSFALGSHKWRITEDNKGCSTRGQPYTKVLKLTGCQDGEFTCMDGQCINMEQRCDQVVHCKDETDERECILLVIKDGYNKKGAPFTLKGRENKLSPVKVNVSTILKNVIEISEVNHIIELKFGITLKWYENRAEYHNLKQDEEFNILSANEIGSIWIPYIIFENTDNDEAITIEDVRSTISVTREGSFVRSGSEISDEIEIFKGEENKITMNQTHSKQFHCTYLLHYFPFDTQVQVLENNYSI